MKIVSIRSHLIITMFLLGFSIAGPVLAQNRVSIKTPGSAFTPEGGGAQVSIDDVAGGRRFRGRARLLLKLRASLQIPSPSTADPKMLRLVIRFRTNPGGPSLRSVEVFNGATAAFGITTMLNGDYRTAEVTVPEGANAWDLSSSPRTVSSQSIVRLTVQYPVGFDSPIDAGEFVLNSVQVDFPRKDSPFNEPRTRLPPILPAASRSVIYAVASNGDLLWYRHDGRADGSMRWTDPKKVGSGWNFKEVFSGGGGVIYAITDSGDLLWYRHDGHTDGSVRWTEPKKVGNGWNFKEVFYGGGGVIYAVTDSGDLLWYRHDGRADGSMRWTDPKKVGSGWNFKEVFSGGGGVTYAITDSGDLLWYRHDGHTDGSIRWNGPKKVGNGWNFKDVFVDDEGS